MTAAAQLALLPAEPPVVRQHGPRTVFLCRDTVRPNGHGVDVAPHICVVVSLGHSQRAYLEMDAAGARGLAADLLAAAELCGE